ncbi:hypothetical protein PNA2_0458 [Pyrococcus sp. NA2]|uniref:DUF257 family protein n=1 Tax=Pyrococcus sp. (strain NA2) TaxID=342949 RepID=UPI000209AA56|nr:DUF257 family protein [Pyrococcus sp. NA2]AEC51375.1 hypothetical protein PNA2_0458 [Pyrococcus sp. NA2]
MEAAKKFESGVFGYLGSINPGELYLITYTSEEPVHLAFFILIRNLVEKNLPFLIIDILDQLHLFKVNLKLAGIDTSVIDNAEVMKVGGFIETGKVVKRINFDSEIFVFGKQLNELINEISKTHGKPVIIIGVGSEKIIRMLERSEPDLETFFSLMGRATLGNEKYSRIVFINTSLIGEKALAEFIELATRVFELKLEGEAGVEKSLSFKIVKSIVFEEYGEEFKVSASRLQEYLKAG